MNTLQIKYRTAGKGLRPQSIRMTSPELDRLIRAKMDQMPELQPISFADGANHGFELVYQYQTECHVVNDNGEVRIYWDYAKEPGGVMGWDEFTDTVPKPSNSFIFATSVDLQAPPGYVLKRKHIRDFTPTIPAPFRPHCAAKCEPNGGPKSCSWFSRRRRAGNATSSAKANRMPKSSLSPRMQSMSPSR